MLRIIILLTCFFNFLAYAERPRLVLAFVVDQLSHRMLMQLSPYMNGGFKKLINEGTMFSNTFLPHAQPSTFPGHLAIVTGCYPCVHGGIANDWMGSQGGVVACDDDDPKKYPVFSPTGFYKYGKSPRSILVDTLSDACMMDCQKPFSVYAFSLKSRSAIALAGRLGKAIWYDGQSGFFTSSKAYFDELPAWLSAFNKKTMGQVVGFSWKHFFASSDPAYSCSKKFTKNFARKPSPFDQLVSLKIKGISTFYRDLQQVPLIHELELQCARICLDNALQENVDGTIVLWIALSSIDKIGHIYGPDSEEYADMMYHLDAQVGQFMEYASKKVSPEQTLYMCTADHACATIPDLLQAEGLTLAGRINSLGTVKAINEMISNSYNVKNAVMGIDAPNVYLNQKAIRHLNAQEKEVILLTVKNQLTSLPGVKKVWTYNELDSMIVNKHQEAWPFKMQLFPGRSGDLIIQVHPYILINKFPTGTGHKTPYNYDTHVPLIFYQPNKINKKEISSKVYSQQITATLAHLLGVARPAACNFDMLSF